MLINLLLREAYRKNSAVNKSKSHEEKETEEGIGRLEGKKERRARTTCYPQYIHGHTLDEVVADSSFKKKNTMFTHFTTGLAWRVPRTLMTQSKIFSLCPDCILFCISWCGVKCWSLISKELRVMLGQIEIQVFFRLFRIWVWGVVYLCAAPWRKDAVFHFRPCCIYPFGCAGLSWIFLVQILCATSLFETYEVYSFSILAVVLHLYHSISWISDTSQTHFVLMLLEVQ